MMGGPEMAPQYPQRLQHSEPPAIVEPALSGVDSSDPSAS